MKDNFYTDQLLDDLLRKRVGASEAEYLLREAGEENPIAAIELHAAAAKAIQQFNVLKQVQAVHRLYAQEAAPATPEKSKLVKLGWVKWTIRVAAMLVILAGGWITYQYTTTSTSSIYGEIYQPYFVNTDRGLGNVVTHQMVDQFKAGDYAAVIKTYSQLSTTGNREKFLTAYAHHQTNNQPAAIALFQEVLQNNQQSGSRLYGDEAEFYLALSQLKNGNKGEAVRLFTAIRSNPDHTFHLRVKEWTLTRLKWIQ